MICIALDLNSGGLITNSEYYRLHHGITYIYVVVYIVVISKRFNRFGIYLHVFKDVCTSLLYTKSDIVTDPL